MNNINKELVRRRFSSAVEQYDIAALPQKFFAQELVQRLRDNLGTPAPGNILEVGCGTGLFSEELINWLGEKEYQYFLNDFSESVKRPLREKVGPRPYFLLGDAEEMAWQEHHYTLITSASAIQWWHHPLNFIHKAANALQGSGLLAYATYLPDNLYQLRQVTKDGLHYATHQEHQDQLIKNGFTDIQLHEQRKTLHFHSITEILRHLKHTGTNALNNLQSGTWTLKKLQELETSYRSLSHLSSTEPLPLTYVALIVTARKA